MWGPAVAADVALHTELIRAAGNSRILSLFENLRDQFKMFAGFGNRTADGPQRFLAIHLRFGWAAPPRGRSSAPPA